MSLRHPIAFSALLLAPATGIIAAESLTPESNITAVTVYVDRAIVTREARVALPVGTQDVVFPGLPFSLNPDLLQVSGSGTATATILDVRATRSQLEASANPRMKELQEQLRTLQAELRVISDHAAVLQQQRDYLEKIKVATTTPPGTDGGALPAIDQWERLVGFYAEGQSRLSTQLQYLDRQREDIQQQISAVQRQVADLQAPGRKAVQNVAVRIDVTQAGEMNLVLNYTVAEASWSPTYDVRVASAEKSIAFGYAAMVRQSSGEDWHNVRLTLSTARPALGGTPPELSTWFLDEYAPPPPGQPMPMSGRVRGAGADMATAAAPEATPALELMAQTATVEAGLTSATFSIPYPADVPADNATHKVTITTQPLEAVLTHLTVPKLAELAYLRAAVTNTSDFPLIAGDVNLYLDGTFVARSRLKTVMPAEKFDLDLGVDEAIHVKRKLLNRLSERTFITRKQELTYDWVITVQNNRKDDAKIILKDQLPISRNARIEVELLVPPAREVVQDADGTITWTLNLKAGEKRELPLKFTVKYPPDLNVEGLE